MSTHLSDAHSSIDNNVGESDDGGRNGSEFHGSRHLPDDRNVISEIYIKECFVHEHEIRADYDDRSIVVYQAYAKAIGRPAVENKRFVAPFSLQRMTWIKPSFLWMMERSGWGLKSGQQMILAVRITRAGWEEGLAQAVLTSPDTHVYHDHEEWESRFKQARVHVQWDPERTLRGKKLTERSIQVGLSRHIVEKYVNEWTINIVDYTPRVRKIYGLLQEGHEEKARSFLPRERVYTLPPEIARVVGCR